MVILIVFFKVVRHVKMSYESTRCIPILFYTNKHDKIKIN